jgi:hypothetical protein
MTPVSIAIEKRKGFIKGENGSGKDRGIDRGRRRERGRDGGRRRRRGGLVYPI